MSEFLNDLRNKALTDDKIEGIKREIEVLKVNVFNGYVENIVKIIKNDIQFKVQRGEFTRAGNISTLSSFVECEPKYSIELENTFSQKIKSTGLEKLLNMNDDDYILSEREFYITLRFIIRKETQSGFFHTSNKYYWNFPNKNLIMKVIEAIKSKAGKEQIKIVGGYFDLKWEYDDEYDWNEMSTKITLDNLDNLKSLSLGAYPSSSTVMAVYGSKLVFKYTISF